MNRNQILIVEDDELVRTTLFDILSQEYTVKCAADAETALSLINHGHYDLIILDIRLPKMDGYRFCSSIRSDHRFASIPIIVFSGLGEIEEKLLGFSLGVNDFVVKTTDLRELRARVKLQINGTKTAAARSAIIDIGLFQIDTAKQTIAMKTNDSFTTLELSPLEFKLLYHFLSHLDHLFTREQLLDQIWGPTRSVTDRSVDAAIAKLRAKLKPHSDSIDSVRGVGYRFSMPADPLKKSG